MLTQRPSGVFTYKATPGGEMMSRDEMNSVQVAAALSDERLGPYLCAMGVNSQKRWSCTSGTSLSPHQSSN